MTSAMRGYTTVGCIGTLRSISPSPEGSLTILLLEKLTVLTIILQKGDFVV